MEDSGQYTVLREIPSVETYCRMRIATGLSAKSAEAAARGLPNTLFAVQILHQQNTVGMGRLIGDGGTAFQVVDIAVLQEYRGNGLGKVIMREIMGYIRDHVPETAYVSLIADGPAHKLYSQFGFQPTAPASVGMALEKV